MRGRSKNEFELKIGTCIYRLQDINLTVNTNQQSTIDSHAQKRKESKDNTKDSHQITKEKKE